ncbi:MAG TPA: protein kinase [Tepidisphaeraceae bacterium]|nr:protein kinase [Tepidisphaeraceae bacterium]
MLSSARNWGRTMGEFSTNAFDLILPARERAASLEGATLGNWKLLEKFSSSGGFGIVYKARHLQAEMGDAAVKVFAFDTNDYPEICDVFAREIAVLKNLTDARAVVGVPRIYDAGIEPGGLPWIAMQFVGGQPLDKWLAGANRTEGQPCTAEIRQILADILKALATVQKASPKTKRKQSGGEKITIRGEGIIHRDIKPSNIMIERTDSGLRAWLLDFGIAQILRPSPSVLQPQASNTSSVAANAITIEYASPEMLAPHQAVDSRSDIFQVGLTAFELLTGCRYWDIWPIQDAELNSAKYPQWLKGVVRRALCWDRERRFQSAREFLKSIKRSPLNRAIHVHPARFIAGGMLGLLLTTIICLGIQQHHLDSRITLLQEDKADLKSQNVDLESKLNSANTQVQALSHIPLNEQSAYADLEERYKYLKEGTASAAEIRDLRDRLSQYLLIFPEDPAEKRTQVKGLRDWIDGAFDGTVTITVKQLQDNTWWGSPTVNYGITSGDETVQKTRRINSNTNLPSDDCAITVKWDPDRTVKVWMHPTDAGNDKYQAEADFNLCAQSVLQDAPGTWRESFAKYDGQPDPIKYFKIGFTIDRSFGPLPPLSP